MGYSHQLNPINPRQRFLCERPTSTIKQPCLRTSIRDLQSLSATFDSTTDISWLAHLPPLSGSLNSRALPLPSPSNLAFRILLVLAPEQPSPTPRHAHSLSRDRNDQRLTQQTEEQGCCQGSAPQAPDYRRDGNLEAQEGLGSRAGSC